MNLPHWLYISRDMALESGNLTHEGTLFGLPAWFAGDDDEVVGATPKCPWLFFWCDLCDWAFDTFATIVPGDYVLRSPIVITGRI